MNIIAHTVEKVEDTTGILLGDRYEFSLTIEVPEDDDLHSENGLYVKVVFAVNNSETRVLQYNIYEQTTNQYIDFELDDEELVTIHQYCNEHIE